MGILRTDKISGLETPTPVTGSVVFDGTGDYLSLASSTDFALGTDDWTVEWFAYPTSSTQYQRHFYLEGGSATTIDGIFANPSGIAFGRTNAWATSETPHPLNQWNHYALVHDSTNMRLYLNGVEVLTTTNDFGTDATKSLNIGYSNSTYGGYFTGNISNFRILRGTALYTSNFTVPTHALEVIGDTVLLCCNNPDSAGADGTGKTITVNGDAAASTVSPGLTRDFTGGTEFSGVTVFDTQGYFVPPSGTTEQRGRGRVLIAGGNETPPSNVISYVNASTSGDAVDFGDLVTARRRARGLSSSTRGVFTGGFTTTPTATYFDIIDFVTISTTGNAVDFNGNTNGAASFVNCASSTRGIMAGGLVPSSPNITDDINYLTIASTGQNVSTFGDLTVARRNAAGFASPTRGIFAAGFTPVPASTMLNTIDFITIASTGNAVDFGDCATTGSGAGSSNSIRGVFQNRTEAGDETIEYVTIASKGNSQDFGNQVTALYMGSEEGGATSTRALWCGGYTNPGGGAGLNNIFYVNIATTGDVQDFGDLIQGTNSNATISDSHGGIS